MGMIESPQELKEAQDAIQAVANETGKPLEYINTRTVRYYKDHFVMALNLVECAYKVRDEILAEDS